MFFNNFINLSYQKDFLILIIGFSLIILCQTFCKVLCFIYGEKITLLLLLPVIKTYKIKPNLNLNTWETVFGGIT